MADYAAPHAHGGQKGTFVGDPAAVHIHIVGQNTHVKVGSSDRVRKDVYFNNKQSITEAMDWLKTKARDGVSGYHNTFEYLRAQARIHGR